MIRPALITLVLVATAACGGLPLTLPWFGNTPAAPPCKCDIPTATPVAIPAERQPVAVVFLVDRTTWYAHVETDLPELALKQIREAIEDIHWVGGDRIYAAWLTPTSPSIEDRLLPPLALPRTAIPTPEPMPTILPAISQVECKHFCEVTVPEYRDKVGDWRRAQERARDRVLKDRDKDLASFRTDAQETLAAVRATPLATTYPDIRGALSRAAEIFDAGGVERRKLVIFSGMIEREGARQLDVQLKGVEVLIEAYHRHGADYQQAGQVQWRALFQQMGARGVSFVPETATSREDIVRFVEAGR